MNYDDNFEVKTVEAIFLVRMKALMTLIGADYNESDGTDAGALVSAFNEDGIPDWSEAEMHEVLSIREIE